MVETMENFPIGSTQKLTELLKYNFEYVLALRATTLVPARNSRITVQANCTLSLLDECVRVRL